MSPSKGDWFHSLCPLSRLASEAKHKSSKESFESWWTHCLRLQYCQWWSGDDDSTAGGAAVLSLQWDCSVATAPLQEGSHLLQQLQEGEQLQNLQTNIRRHAERCAGQTPLLHPASLQVSRHWLSGERCSASQTWSRVCLSVQTCPVPVSVSRVWCSHFSKGEPKAWNWKLYILPHNC